MASKTSLNPVQLEICAGSVESVRAAAQGGADRVELCAALSEGGLTPSHGLLCAALAETRLRTHVLIRPRGGDFVYSEAEADAMVRDVEHARSLGAHGIAIGALTPAGLLDRPLLQRLIAAADGMALTFHRAFDLCLNPFQAIEEIIDLGFSRLLTSGLALSAEEGIPTLKRLVAMSAGRLSIMPAAGVSPTNAARILQATGAREIHASARSLRRSAMQPTAAVAKMGASDTDDSAWLETDASIVANLRAAIDNMA